MFVLLKILKNTLPCRRVVNIRIYLIAGAFFRRLKTLLKFSFRVLFRKLNFSIRVNKIKITLHIIIFKPVSLKTALAAFLYSVTLFSLLSIPRKIYMPLDTSTDDTIILTKIKTSRLYFICHKTI